MGIQNLGIFLEGFDLREVKMGCLQSQNLAYQVTGLVHKLDCNQAMLACVK
jgi:hypothetical protein